MNIKTLIASLVLGSSSVAMAAPSVVTFTGTGTQYGATTTVVRDHRDEPRTLPAPAYRGGWYSGSWNGGWGWRRPAPRPVVYQQPVTLASGLSFNGEDRKFITVGAQAGLFGKLELNADGGRTFIKQVYVQFADGQEQVIRNLDRTLTGNESLTLDLDGNRRAIRRIVVYGTELPNRWRRAPGAFTVIAA